MSQFKPFKLQLKPLLKFLAKPIIPQLGLVLSLIIFAAVTGLSLLSNHHFLFNLEPYPDGLLYTLSARNLALGKGLKLVYDQSFLTFSVPTLYPLVLSLGYLVNSSPTNFIWVNLALGLITIGFIYKTGLSITQSKWLGLLSVIAYLSHSYIWLLPILPMTENLALCLLAISLFYLFKSRLTTIEFIYFGLAVIGLALTRFAALPISLVLLGWGWWKFWQASSTQSKRLSWLVLIPGIGLILVGLNKMGLNPWLILKNFILSLASQPPSRHFSFSYLRTDSIGYFKILVGWNEKFLWYRWPLTSLVMTGAALLTVFNKKVITQHKWWLSSLLVCQIPILLVLNGVDARYLILILPLLSIGLVLLIQQLYLKIGQIKTLLLLIGLLLVHLATQALLFKQIAMANIFHRTRAWQYEAILNFNDFFSRQSSGVLVTALPPFLVDAYQTSNYQLLPLSNHQEFLAKKELMWGQNINYTDLVAEYKQRLANGEKLYISNSYITHQWEVVADYESLKQLFEFTKVADGCQDACNIYELSLPATPLSTTVKSKSSAK